MDWTQAFTVIGVIGAFFIYMMNRMDVNQKQSNDKFNRLESRFNNLENRMTAMEVELKNVGQRLGKVEDCVMPRKVFHIKDSDQKEEPKEN